MLKNDTRFNKFSNIHNLPSDVEVKEFLGNLTQQELSDYNILYDDILRNSVYLHKVYDGGKVVAIGGIAKWYRLFYHTYYMVKTDYQSKGIGNEMSHLILNYAKEHDLPYLIGAYKLTNVKSTKIHNKLNYKILWHNNEVSYSMLLFKKNWYWFELILRTVIPIYNSKFGLIIRKPVSNDYELIKFLNSLTEDELNQYDILKDDIANNYVFMEKIHRDGKLVAIGGIAKWYKLFHHLYFMIKTDYQSQGIGDYLSQLSLQYAKEHKIPFMLGVAKITSPRSIKIVSKLGYKRIWDDGKLYYSMLLLNSRWSWFMRLMKIIMPVYGSPLGKPIKILEKLGRITECLRIK